MPSLNPDFCQNALNHLYVLMDGEPFAYTSEHKVMETAEWRVRVCWLPAQPNAPRPDLREPMVEVVATNKKTRERAYMYKNGTGNDIHPEFGTSGWRFHMV